MGGRKVHLKRLLIPALLLLALLLLVGCGVDTKQNTFDPAGDVAGRQRDLFNIVLWPAVVILVVVEAAMVYAVIRFRRKKGDGLPAQTHGNTRLEIAWTIAPAILLLILAVPTVDAIIDLGRAPAADALQVRVIGQQFIWEFQYLDPEFQDDQGNPLTVRGEPGEPGSPGKPAELHIPVGREIGIMLEARDVLHSFWVPKLAGKLDAVPGRTNRMWLNATEPGSYSGQCAEFCGLQHADMRLIVVAESQDDFEAWIADQLEGGGAASSGSDESVVAPHGE